MRPISHRISTLFLALCSVALLVLSSAGCDKLQESPSDRADRTVTATIDDTLRSNEAGNVAVLKSAAADLGISPAVRSRAKQVLAQAQVDAANQLAREISDNEVQIARLVAEIAQQGAAIQGINTQLEGYQKLDPKNLQDTAAKSIAQVQGDEKNQTWLADKNATLSSLAAVKQEISRLEGQITQKQQQVSQTTTQRTALLAQGDQAVQVSQNMQGQEAVDQFKRAMELRHSAQRLASQIDLSNAELGRLQRELAVQHGQQKALETAVARLKEQGQQFEAAWKAMQARIELQSQLARKIVEGSPSAAPTTQPQTPDSINARAAALATLATDTKALRQHAEALLRDAADSLNDAAQYVGRIQSDIRVRQANQRDIEKDIWQWTLALHDPQAVQYCQAMVQETLASLKAGEYASLISRMQLARYLESVLQKAKLAVPKDLSSGELQAQATAALNAAKTAYTDADNKLENVITMGTPDLKDAANVSRVTVLYGSSLLARGAGEQALAQKKFAEAKKLAEQLTMSRTIVLPVSLQAALIPKTPRPSGVPATAPATP